MAIAGRNNYYKIKLKWLKLFFKKNQETHILRVTLKIAKAGNNQI